MAAIITSITIILSIFFLLPYLYFLPKVGPTTLFHYSASPSSTTPAAYTRSGLAMVRARADSCQAVLAAIITLVVYASESRLTRRTRGPW
jgi:hypothetical protein